MIKYQGELDGKPLVGIGLSDENLRRLKEGAPIHINLLEVNLPYNVTILLFAGPTEETMVERLRSVGAITPKTIQHTFQEH
jgi:hypothetical protein